MSAFRIIRRLRDLLDFTLGAPSDGDVVTYEAGTGEFVLAAPAASGAPTSADYLVGTANGSLSGEIVVGTSPGGELGGTWAAPTVDATHSGSSHAQAAAVGQAAAEATAQAALTTHETDATAAHAGSAISNTPAGNIAATTAQAAINELDTEKAAASHAHAGEDITSGTVADARIAATIARDSEVTSAIAGLSAVYQPLDSDLTSIAALTTSAFGRGLLALADAAALLAAAGGAAEVRQIIAGSGLSGGGTLAADRTLDVSVDGSTIEVSGDALRVKDGGITAAKVASDVATQAELDALAAQLSRDEILSQGLGLKGWTFNKAAGVTSTSLGSGDLYFTACPFKAGDVITNLWVLSEVAGTGQTLCKLGVYTFEVDYPVRLALTADMSADLASTGPKVKALTAPYEVTEDGNLYLAALQVGGTPARLGIGYPGVTNGKAIGSFPRHAGKVGGQTDLPTDPNLFDSALLFFFGWD